MWSNCLFGLLVDKRLISKEYFQDLIMRYWKLQGKVIVKGMYNVFYVLEISNMEDLIYIHNDEPRTFRNKLVVVAL